MSYALVLALNLFTAFCIGVAASAFYWGRKMQKAIKNFDDARKMLNDMAAGSDGLQKLVTESLGFATVEMSGALNDLSRMHVLTGNIRNSLAEVVAGRRVGEPDISILQSCIDEIDRHHVPGQDHARAH